MKSILSLLIVSVVLIISCSKSNVNPAIDPASLPLGSLTANVDGNNIAFDSFVNATQLIEPAGTTPAYHEILFYGRNANAGALDEISFTIAGRNPIIAKTYLDDLYQTTNDYSFFQYTLNEFDTNGVYQFVPPATAPFATTIITSITDSTIQGTFNGKLTYITDTVTKATVTHIITNGAFNLRLIQDTL